MRLETLSQVNAKEQPFLHRWDVEYRRNHTAYQHEIDKITFQLQKGQRGFAFLGQWNYPHFYQRDLLKLNLLKKKQLVGQVFPEELEEYEQREPTIRKDMHLTFNSSFYVPYYGLGTAAGLNLYAHLVNLSYTWRIMFLAVPIVYDYVCTYSARNMHTTRSNQFLSWVLQYRQSRARVELDRKQLPTGQIDAFKNTYKGNASLYDVYDNLVKLVGEQPVEDIQKLKGLCRLLSSLQKQCERTTCCCSFPLRYACFIVLQDCFTCFDLLQQSIYPLRFLVRIPSIQLVLRQ
eukprot:TRINITY_DN2613_c0_g1_i3.p1 TRINITY_DN2613_c0_g1~~TRINITY_DN2613_c0_g1_i3.p1  ORF type:complete len:290 (-),score=33.53 TRINITY_DN2613_c0_g1_i3:47-916(-)